MHDPVENEFLTRLYEHQGILHKICFMYASQSMSQEDLYQEITLQLWKSYPSFREESLFSTWMYRVALNTALTTTRRKNLFTTTSKPDPGTYEMETAMDFSEEVKLLYRAITKLKPVEKAIVLLWLEEKSYSEIAAITGISEKNVSVKLVRIKARLAEIIQKLQ